MRYYLLWTDETKNLYICWTCATTSGFLKIIVLCALCSINDANKSKKKQVFSSLAGQNALRATRTR